MRNLVLITTALYHRDFVATGAFDDLGEDTLFLSGANDVVADLFASDPRWLGAVEMPRDRSIAYVEIRKLLLTHYRFRSRTARVKLQKKPFARRTLAKLAAMPGVRQRTIRERLARTGLHQEMLRMVREAKPDLLIAPSAGIDALVLDLIRVGKELGIPTLALMYNWDNLSSKAAFAIDPDYLGVAGFQAAGHAERIHRIGRDRVGVLGSPYIDGHFRHEPDSTESPYPFPYVLFAGCYQPFDERVALEQLDEAIEREGLDLKIVYLPHPRRLPRKRSDYVDASKPRHVVVELRMREDYEKVWRDYREGSSGVAHKMVMRQLPAEAYPALLENAEFVICPLSTMTLEAAIFRRRVLVIAHHDGVHPTSPGVAIKYLHFEGVADVETFKVTRTAEDLERLFVQMARNAEPAS